MIAFSVDITGILRGMPITKEEAEHITQLCVERVTYSIYTNIVREANNKLHSTRQRYIRALQKPVIGRLKGVIALGGDPLANMIENGASPFDMKEGFERSRKVKYNKDGGWYLTIPYRYAVSGSIGESEAFSGVLPSAIEDVMKELRPTLMVGEDVVDKGEALGKQALKKNFGIVIGGREAIKATKSSPAFGGYIHKTPAFQGMVRQQQVYENAIQGQNILFRRVGKNSDPLSWIHRGINPYKLMDAGFDNTDTGMVMGNTINKILSKLGA